MAWLGIDTGGTFTDFVWYVPERNEVRLVKVPSNPTELASVLAEGLQRLGERLDDGERIVHGTTLVTNTVLEGDGAKVATLTTGGYRDLVEIGRQNRFEMYNLRTLRARPLSPRRWRYEVDERVLWDGSEETAPRRDEVLRIAQRLHAEGVEAVAVCLLFSYLNDAHERQVKEWLSESGDWFITASHEVGRQSREYERFSTTILNAYLGPRVNRYMDGLQGHFAAEGVDVGRVFFISTSGGTMTWQTACEVPVNLLDSGPAGGVRGAVESAEALGIRDIITHDMGGTSTDVCLVKNLEPVVTSEGYIDRRPFMVPKLDISTIGAGGGSIAWLDIGGELQVGPKSAGAIPGPACYGRGGAEPTVTDANVVLGRLASNRLLGGSVKVDAGRAEQAVATIAAAFEGMSVQDAAEGIVRIAVAKMTTAIREVSVARGLDPRDFALVAYGGAGPMHATAVAEALGIPTVVVPHAPGNFSALGLLMSDVRHDFVQSRFVEIAALSVDEYERMFAGLEREAVERLAQDGFSEKDVRITRSADLRYRGQWFELNIPVPFQPSSMDEVDGAFRKAHLERYRVDMDRPTEFVNFRIAAHGLVEKPNIAAGLAVATGSDVTSRPVRFDGEWHDVRVYDRQALVEGADFDGPAVVEEFGATTVVGPGFHVQVHASGALMINRQGG